jgi:hypothetical protein
MTFKQFFLKENYGLPHSLLSNYDTGAYRFGSLKISFDTIRSKMAGRSTGHFGTGLYFLGKQGYELAKNSNNYGKLPLLYIDLNGLNLLKPKNPLWFHKFLKEFNDLFYKNDLERFEDSFYQRKHDLIKDSDFLKDFLFWCSSYIDIKKSEKEYLLAARNTIKAFKDENDIRSPSTIFLQNLGYDGIDVRETDADNTDHGSVIFAKKIS